MGSIIKKDGGDQIKNMLLYTLGILVLGIIGFSGISAEAASVPDSWNQKFKCETNCPRFTVLKAWDNAAVLDKETGLIWEQSPSLNEVNWAAGQLFCNQLVVSNRMGWRLPTLQEMTSLVDKTQTNMSLPSAHPFSNLLNTYYWTSTTSAGNATLGWGLNLSDGGFAAGLKSNGLRVWCVRGGSGVDAQ